MSTSESIAEALANLVGEAKATEVLGKNPEEVSNHEVAERLLHEPLVKRDARHLFTRISEAMLAERHLASGITIDAQLEPYFNALFLKAELDKEKIEQNVKKATFFLKEFTKNEATIPEHLVNALVKDLAVFITSIEGFLDIEIVASFAKGDKNKRQVAASLSPSLLFSFNPDLVKLNIPFNDIGMIFFTLEQKNPALAFELWSNFKADLFHECMHPFQLFDSELFFNLSTTIWYILKTKISEAMENEAKMKDFIEATIIDEIYMHIPHEAEASVARAFIEQVQTQVLQEKAQSIHSFGEVATLLSALSLEIKMGPNKNSTKDVAVISDFLEQLKILRGLLHECAKPISIGFGFKAKQEYYISPVDILCFVKMDDELEAITLVTLAKTFNEQKKIGLQLLEKVKNGLKSANADEGVGEAISKLQADFNNLHIA